MGEWVRYEGDYGARATEASFCLLFEGGVPVFIYVRLIARQAGVRIMIES